MSAATVPAAPVAPAAPTRSKADYFPILFCLAFWAWNTPMYKYLQAAGCDPYSMSFYRTLTAAVTVTVWELVISGPRAMLTEALRQHWRFLVLAFFFIGGMFAGVAGAYYTNATLAILLSRATPLVALSLSAIFYLDERRLIRRPDFLVGFALALAGLLGLSLMRPAEPAASSTQAAQVAQSAQDAQEKIYRAGSSGAPLRNLLTGGDPEKAAASPPAVAAPADPAPSGDTALYAWGVLLLLTCALLWGSYSAVVKGMVIGARPFTITAITFWLAAFMALPIMFWWGDAGWILQGGWLPVGVLLISGVIMGIVEGLFFLSVSKLGLTSSTSATLLVPFFTALIAWQFLGEPITLPLVGFGVLMLTGLGVIVYARTRLLAGEQLLQPVLTAGRASIAVLTIGQSRPRTPADDEPNE